MLKADSVLGSDGSASIEFGLEDLLGLHFIGNYKPDTEIQFYGPFAEHVSMGNVSMQICHNLVKKFDKVAIQNYIPVEWIDKELESYAGLNSKADIGIFLGTPDTVPKIFFNHTLKIGGFVCETDAINPAWVKVCNKLDLVFVPTQWCKSAFRKSGVTTPIIVVPHGIEEQYQPHNIDLSNQPFTFYNTFHATSFCSRKSMNELVRTFVTTFSGKDDVKLRLRTDSSPALAECARRYNFGSLIVHDELVQCSTDEFAKIYSQVHCTVHPSKGEGFGLIPFQSIACETPVIAPHKTGMADYLNHDNSLELKTKGRVEGEAIGNSHGTYFGIDEEDLHDKLLYMYQNWKKEKQKLVSAGPMFRKHYAWDNILNEFLTLLTGLLGAESEAERSVLLQPYQD